MCPRCPKPSGVPGIRIGWLVDSRSGVAAHLSCGQGQISISGSVIDEWIAEQVLTRRQELLQLTLTEMRERRQIGGAVDRR